MPNSYEREPLFQNNGERPFCDTSIVIHHCTQLSNDYFLLGASICTRVRPDAPNFALTLLSFVDTLPFYIAMPYAPKNKIPEAPCSKGLRGLHPKVRLYQIPSFDIGNELIGTKYDSLPFYSLFIFVFPLAELPLPCYDKESVRLPPTFSGACESSKTPPFLLRFYYF